MKDTLWVLAAFSFGAVCLASCADTATCFPGEVLVDGLCMPAPAPATGGTSAASGGDGGIVGGAAGALGEGGAP